MSSGSTHEPEGLDAALEPRLRLDGQAGPATRISKDRARELVLAAMSRAPEATVAEDELDSRRPKAWLAGRSRIAVAAAALLVAFISGASASLWVWGRKDSPVPPPATPRQAPAMAARETPAPSETALEEEEESPSGKVVTRPRRAEAMPEDLLERANRLRAEGAFAEARDAYAQVFRRYPGTLSAYAAQVAAGSLELEHLARPDEARRLFERALQSRPMGALSLEIYQGLAASYGALGRARDEMRTLERLVAAYPSAHAAKRAKARLEELAKAP